MKKILIPIDFSKNSINAINYALALFKHEFCKFYILNAYQEDINLSNAPITKEVINEVIRTAGKDSQLQLKNTLKQIKKLSQNSKHLFKILSANNILVDEADRVVEEKNIDLIVMGTLGKTNNKKLTFGSHTLQVLKYVRCPVLVIPQGYTYKKPNHILFATDYSMPYQQRELALLNEVASDYKSTIDILYISDSGSLSVRQEGYKSFIKENLKNTKIHFKITKDKNISNEINKYIEDYETDILVMINRRHSFLENILFKDNIDKISLSIKIPFLALQNMRRT
ncbi:Nucleotide-binding universal stress protein, UspA family [Polaribacter sp. KT25b]|jgi:nucleotide-binding universal stress UspA family protein|uniref:universal stress protein n=1 Tax=Polaribacter sp. KT25b TaxID=1855336 RepID=UPI00087DD590|nr:universal stress protein [Polaribacter sp. KT25b]SDS57959.1 Nucleotide-binding universal stress protein, UspA family [Polaribacter sp. KT25b]